MKKLQKVFLVLLGLVLLFQAVTAQPKRTRQKNSKPAPVISLSMKCPCDFPPLQFETNSVKLTDKAKALLTAIAKVIKQQPQAVLNVNLSSITTKSAQGNCFRKIEQIRNYLAEVEGISYDRINTHCDFSGATQAQNQCLMDCK